jgi:hypothetical protein
MKMYKLLALVLATALLLSLAACGKKEVPAVTTTPETTAPPATTLPPNTADPAIQTAYTYPVRPGSDEWKALKTDKARQEACAIPEDILKKMTTDALLESIYAYPMLNRLLVYIPLREGYRRLCKWFNGLAELSTREDAQVTASTLDPSTFAIRQSMTADEIQLADYYYSVICLFLQYHGTQAYAYPVTPTSAEWKSMSKEEKIAACQVPEDILATMGGEALTLTVINYPLLADAITADNPESAIQSALATCNALTELLSRKDTLVGISPFYTQYESPAEYIGMQNAATIYNILASTT